MDYSGPIDPNEMQSIHQYNDQRILLIDKNSYFGNMSRLLPSLYIEYCEEGPKKFAISSENITNELHSPNDGDFHWL